ncbi:hypothetical protein MMC14_007659 [Varicellaria rhodocarpa]|nr:hypothetical protein [Varicellaria rhodocarpa]
MQAFTTRFLRSPIISTIPIPKQEPNELLVKVAYVSLNPTDYKHAALALPPSKVLGCDFSGTVVALGHTVSPSAFSPGERIAGIIHGCHYSHTGALAEYLVADASLCFIQGSGLGIHAIQQARLDHPETFIIATASKQHHAKLRNYGAGAVFDYNSPTLVPDIRKLGRDIRRALDCHSEGRSTVLTAECMLSSDDKEPETLSQHGERRRRLIRTLPPAMISGTVPPSVRADEWILSYTALGKPFWFLFKYYPASAHDHHAASTYMKRLTRLLAEGKLQPISHRLMPGGLKDIGKGFEEMRQGRVKGRSWFIE